ncbi:hypothetical protein, partial [Streptomyces sp. adm13(2018)]|uniref:hypothetical protein n=1 Tax=Streptomyces sp. adm13(2018) TaxID=2479007 RepID=UPI001C9D28F1
MKFPRSRNARRPLFVPVALAALAALAPGALALHAATGAPPSVRGRPGSRAQPSPHPAHRTPRTRRPAAY